MGNAPMQSKDISCDPANVAMRKGYQELPDIQYRLFAVQEASSQKALVVVGVLTQNHPSGLLSWIDAQDCQIGLCGMGVSLFVLGCRSNVERAITYLRIQLRRMI